MNTTTPTPAPVNGIARRNAFVPAQIVTAGDEMPTAPSSKELLPTDIRAEASAQQRVQMNVATVQDYAEAMKEGAAFPPLTVFIDATTSIYWLADGFHRLNAHRAAFGEDKRITCRVMPGSRRDALRYALGANEVHGLRRTNEDKRKAVQTALGDEEWSQWSDREIAKLCKVSNRFVGNMRSQLIAPTLTVNVHSEKPVQPASTPDSSVNVHRSDPSESILTVNVHSEKPVQPASTPDSSVNVHRSDPSESILTVNVHSEKPVQPASTPDSSVNVHRSDPSESILTVNVHSEKPVQPASPERQYITKHGTVATMKTSGINSQRTPPAASGEPTYASVWQIEQFLKTWLTAYVDQNPDKQIGTLGMMKEQQSGTIRADFERELTGAGFTFRKSDLTQAINNVLDQKMQMKRERQAKEEQPPTTTTSRPLVEIFAEAAPASKPEVPESPSEHTERKYALAARIAAVLQQKEEFKALFGKTNDWLNLAIDVQRIVNRIESLQYPT